MKIVAPQDRTTLLLNSAYMPINITTARAAFNHVITGRVKPIDRFGMPHGFPEDDKGHLITDITQHYWFLFKDVLDGTQEKDGTVTPYDERDGIYFANQPILRSAQGSWPIPTIALTTSKFFRNKTSGKITIQRLAKHYKNVCQICNQKFPTAQLTIEHVFARSKGGANDETNCIPTCQPCNSQKADIVPYFDSNGVNLEDKIQPLPSFLVANQSDARPEWSQYIVPTYKH